MNVKDQENMTAMDMIRAAMKEKGIKSKDFAAMIGKAPSNLSSQMSAGYLKAEDWRAWADALGYKVIMIPKEE